MQIKYTNFDGNWDDDCQFCGNPHRNHQVDLGELDGVRYIHRQPCPEEQRRITKQHIIRANTVRAVITLYEIVIYFWNKIPFKGEAKLIFSILKSAYAGTRGILYYWFMYRKRK